METAYSRMDGTLTPRDSMEENAKSPSKVLLNIKTIIPECLNDMTCALKDKQNYYIERFGAAMTVSKAEIAFCWTYAARRLYEMHMYVSCVCISDSFFVYYS